ncbi:hypothetical protein [Aurantiacibacter sp. D1-12]|uniref:hypothetical protein n=1 Tax=Aurantiacibacter sp. D1-12 TaxID=2993658 RepID=UPI00237CF839|nr:hypothetical protein [Aurantiacibacter sp. D1-12]MDE1467100.1 hypothetical protein [Aurantiacibacter sp. D1-12]
MSKIKTTSTKMFNGKAGLLLAGVSGIACLATTAPVQASDIGAQSEFSALSSIALGESNGAVDERAAREDHRTAAPELRDIGVSRDTSSVGPVLSLGLVDFADTVQRGTPASFLGYSNYPAFVERAELRLFAAGSDLSGPPHAVIPADKDGVMTWTPSTYAADRMVAVYRVYDADGNFDETQAQDLKVLSAGTKLTRERMTRPEFGVVDSAAQRGIALDQAQPVAISGTVDGDVSRLHVSGQLTAHDAGTGQFFSSQLLPSDCTDLSIIATDDCGTAHALSSALMPDVQDVLNAGASQDDPQDGLTIVTGELGDDAFDHAIDVRVDSGRIDPVLATGLADSVRVVVRGETATFVSYNNYPALIERGEIRVFERGVSAASTPFAIIPVDANGVAQWQPDAAARQDMFFVYRVYDAEGQFDETIAHELTVLHERPGDDEPPSRPLFGTQDEAATRTIRQRRTSTVTVSGAAQPGADMVRVGDQIVPVDENGRWVGEQIIPQGMDQITVAIGQGDDVQFAAIRNLQSDSDDWFIVGQGEVTFGTTWSSGPAEDVSGSTLADGDYAIGRAAFYANGPLGGDWEVTASLDTGEAEVQDLLSNLDRKDPRQLLRRITSEQYYPTYGDDSTLVEDAPTQGRFYLRVENGLSQAIIGNFVAQATGTDLVQLDRGLFGALIDINTAGTTSFGERDAQLLAFASDPGTVPAREEFRGTGGSLYFLQRQDVTVGSERVRVEIRDRETGIVIESTDLHPRQDYDFDPFNGRLTLLRPLGSTANTGGTVREGSAAGNVPVLVVRYEYTPPVGSLDGYTVGARGTVWVGDTLRFGATAQRDTVEEANQTLLGADALLRITAGTFVRAEVAQSEGPGFAQSNSIDGGLSFTDIANPGANITAQAYRAEVGVNFAELAGRQGNMGTITGFFEHMDAGYSAAGRLSPTETQRWGLAADIPLGETGNVRASYDSFDAEGRGSNKTAELDLSNNFTLSGGILTASLGVRHDDLTPGALFNATQNGSRTDAALELKYAPSNTFWTVHAFGQATLDNDASRQRNNRVGAGVTADLSDRFSLTGELSGGDGGLGADVQLNHRLGEGSEAYVGYTLLADRTDTGLEPQNLFTGQPGGALVVGARHRFTDSLSVFGENRVSVGGDVPTLARSFGLQFDPTDEFSVTGTFENGRIEDPNAGVFRRTAGSIALGYQTDDVRAGTALEVRHEDGVAVGGGDQTVWLLRSNFSYAVNPDWRFVSQFNIARADTEGTSIRAAEFTEAIAGFAYRPIDNDRVNGIVRFQYFEDLGPVGQITGSGAVESPKQESLIFSADFNFDLSDRLTLGTRYGYRNGRVSLGRDSDEFVSSDAHLAVVRLDYNVIREWDVMAEGRALWVTQADDLRLGALGGVYRHIGDTVKVGVGYSWSDFSDDLTDQSYTSHGPFLNILGRF